MKAIHILMSAAIAISLVSCNENERLAKELYGTWAGTPENITDNTAITATLIETYFMADAPEALPKGSYGGEITISGMVSCSTQIIADSTSAEPMTLTASGTSTINGTWTVIDDDEIAVTLKPETLQVNMDPEAVTVANNVVTNNDNPNVETLKPGITTTLREGIKQALAMRYASIRQIDDIKVKGPLLKFEIGNNDYVFTRQGDSK